MLFFFQLRIDSYSVCQIVVELGRLWGVAKNEAQFLCHEIKDIASPQVSTYENGNLLEYADTFHDQKSKQMDSNKTE